MNKDYGSWSVVALKNELRKRNAKATGKKAVLVQRCLRQGLHTLSQVANSTSLVKPESCLLSSIRTNVRCYFPRPNEVMRVRKHGWEKRMSTKGGRRVIMRRMLKGRFVLTH